MSGVAMIGHRIVSSLTAAPQAFYARGFSSSGLQSREFAHVVRRSFRPPRSFSEGDPDTLLPTEKPAYPPYPYGESLFYKQSNRGLYGGKCLQFGHKVSEKFNQKSTRIFHPNVQRTALWSDAFKRVVSVRLVASVLRTITKEGGLDNYLLKDSPARVKELGPFGWRLRYAVLRKLEERARTEPKTLDGFKVGKARLIKDLFTLTNSEGKTFKEFRLAHQQTTGDKLLEALVAEGADASKYKST